ncbi:chorismate mutase [Roseibaca sp. Y0-43]|uniref:chorismate mutase n=1 Tax=Roseibaca sp. Y0-43 TaxID=2816854 RepID=UPI001D0C8DE7|nr:chorismate mutase [Roseibaca sp. Y0-43]MCC1480092.1 chorismate mutase [Roseibaca sp. Y0-43]
MTLDPTSCQTMAELRVQIDQIDRELVALLARRVAHIDRAIELKPAEGLPARIDSRVNDVLAKVEAEALRQGLDPALVRKFWTELIDWSIAREEQVLGKR